MSPRVPLIPASVTLAGRDIELNAEIAARNERQTNEILRLNRRVAELAERVTTEEHVTSVLSDKLIDATQDARKWRQIRTMVDARSPQGQQLAKALADAGIRLDG